MKKFFSSLIISATLISCAPKFSTSITNQQTPLSTKDIIVVLQKFDEFENDGTEIGTVSVGEKGFTSKCSYDEIMVTLKNMAQQYGANVIKISKHKVPDTWSSCDRITAKLYRVNNPRKFEREFRWHKDRKLVWEDFKGEPKPAKIPNAAAETYYTIGCKTNPVHIFADGQFFVNNTFDCNLSWVKEDQKNNHDILQHEQGHFDLSEIYTRLLRKKMVESKLGSANLSKVARSLHTQVFDSCTERQELYDRETEHGLNKRAQRDWNFVIETELRSLDYYSE